MDVRPQHLLNPGGGEIDALHPVVEVVNLPAPAELLPHGVLQNRPVVLQHIGLHRLAVRRRLLDGGHVPEAGQGHVQRPGDGRRREGQHVHLTAQLLQALLMGDTEALLLVDDEEPQVLERHVLLQQLVGADEKVHPALLCQLQDALLVLGGREAGQDLNPHREIPEAAHGRGVMLLNGGGHQNRGLLSIQHAFHHRPEGHLRFPVAHIAAQKAVHGPGLLHVLLDLRDGPELIVGLRVGKGLLKLPLPGGVLGEGEAGAALALGVEPGQALGQVLDGLLGPGFLFGPLSTAQLVQLLAGGAVLAAADIFAYQIQGRGGDVEAVPSGVVYFNVVLFHPVHRHPLDAREAAHAVVGVDHQVSWLQIRVGLDFLAVGVLFHPGPLPGRGGQLALGQHRQLQRGPLAPGGEGSHGNPDFPGDGHAAAL